MRRATASVVSSLISLALLTPVARCEDDCPEGPHRASVMGATDGGRCVRDGATPPRTPRPARRLPRPLKPAVENDCHNDPVQISVAAFDRLERVELRGRVLHLSGPGAVIVHSPCTGDNRRIRAAKSIEITIDSAHWPLLPDNLKEYSLGNSGKSSGATTVRGCLRLAEQFRAGTRGAVYVMPNLTVSGFRAVSASLSSDTLVFRLVKTSNAAARIGQDGISCAASTKKNTSLAVVQGML